MHASLCTCLRKTAIKITCSITRSSQNHSLRNPLSSSNPLLLWRNLLPYLAPNQSQLFKNGLERQRNKTGLKRGGPGRSEGGLEKKRGGWEEKSHRMERISHRTFFPLLHPYRCWRQLLTGARFRCNRVFHQNPTPLSYFSGKGREKRRRKEVFITDTRLNMIKRVVSSSSSYDFERETFSS